jgi:hypothetical protein
MAHLMKIKIGRPLCDFEWNPKEALATALNERERFLINHPHLRSFQDGIDKVLDKAGGGQNRLAVIALLLESKLIELHRHLQSLNAILLRATCPLNGLHHPQAFQPK